MNRIPVHIQNWLLKIMLWLVWVLCFGVVLAVALKARKAHAQFGGVEQPMFAASSAGSQSLDTLLPMGMGFRWSTTNLTSSPVSAWTDEIIGSVMTQSTVGKQPTWTTNDSVYFDSNFWLQMTNVIIAGGATAPQRRDCLLMVLKWETATERYLLDAGTPAIGCTSAGKYYNGAGPMGNVSVNTWVDYVYAGGSTEVTQYVYTNGVLMASGNVQIGEQTYGYLGRLGAIDSSTYNFKGWIREFIIWTNTISFTTAQVSNIHYYSVQKWGVYNP